MRVVYISDYTGFRHGQGSESHTNLLPEPFNRETLLSRIHDVLTLGVHHAYPVGIPTERVCPLFSGNAC